MYNNSIGILKNSIPMEFYCKILTYYIGPIGSHIPLKHDSAQLTSVGQLLFVGHVTVQFTVQSAVWQFLTLKHTNTCEVSQVTSLVSPVPPFTCKALKFETVLFVNESFAPKFLFFMVLVLIVYTLNF